MIWSLIFFPKFAGHLETNPNPFSSRSLTRGAVTILQSAMSVVCDGSVLEKNLYAVMFGDYVSLYLAALREVDPCNVDPIVDIKARMRAVLPQ